MDNENFILDLLKKLVENEIDFVVCGGIACVLQGCERTTFDLDIAVSFENENIERLVRFFKENSVFIPRIPEPIEKLKDKAIREKWIKEKNALVYTLITKDGMFQIDIFLWYPIDFETLKRNADIFKIEDVEIKVSSKEDLLKAKEMITPLRDKDLLDIKELKRMIDEEKD